MISKVQVLITWVQ